ncbi:MAG TPA: tannase/feruloyl esterase family alpha/beta hydrolase [Bryobacteraceae bacterium]|nr:tannase/feruloyl esterase family alpha/beta hydrolase [Bryobacteraceae bacterium]
MLKLPNTSITAAQVVAAGKFLPPGEAPSPADLAIYKTLPTFCRVQGTIRPTTDSNIEFEVWLPVAGWNGKYMGTGNYDSAGYINYPFESPLGNSPGLAYLLAGYATSSTDTGHKLSGPDSQWAMGHPEKIVDWGYRGIHQTAEKSKAIIHAFYGGGPKHSYFSGCSNGGRQGLMEAQRFPSDYDGIIAGAPAISITHLVAALWMNARAIEADPANKIPPAKVPAVQSAMLAACDTLDGLKDGLIDDPRECHFDPAALLCREAESDACLTQPQVEILRKIYAGIRTSKGELIYPGNLPGADFQFWFGLPKVVLKNRGAYLIFQNQDWDYHSFNVDRDVKIADETVGEKVNARDPNLTAFKNLGGKLIVFQGWSDANAAPANTLDYYEKVVANMGQMDAGRFSRLYMVPGMEHCGGGPGPNSFGAPMTAALERWVEQGAAPDRIIATKYKSDFNSSSGIARTRPLCPYPQVARYRGSGSIDDAANFVCRAP